MSNRLSDRRPGRGVLHTPHNHSQKGYLIACQTIVGRMQYAPTLPEKKSDFKGWCGVMFGTKGDKYVFHAIMSNRLSDRYPCRGVLHTPHIDSTSIHAPLAGRLVGRMQYTPTLPAEKSDLKGWRGGMFGTMVDKYVFLFFMSNRLSDRYPGRGVLHTPLIDSTSTLSPFAGRLVRRMRYAPTLPAEKSDFKACCGGMFGTRGDKSVFHSSMSNRLSDRYPCRGVLNTPLARLSSTPTPFAGRLIGRMQYAPTLPEKDEVSSGWCFPSSRTMVDQYASFFSMFNRLSDRCPGRAQKHTPLARLSSIPTPFAGRLVGRMQYAPTLSEKDKASLGGCYLLSRTIREEYAFHSIMSNRLLDRYPCRAQKHTPLVRLSSTLSPFAGRLVGRMQYAPTLPAEKSDLKGW